jgi:8-oxo-dGTP diphosphatase
MIDVTCAIIRNEENEILVVQRGPGSDHPEKWEFPGGKIKQGETAEDCILREVSEELSLDIVIYRQLDPVIHNYGFKKIRLIPFICDTLDESPSLTEHIAFRWLKKGEIMDTDFSEADIFVARQYVEAIIDENEDVIPQVNLSNASPSVDSDLKDLICNMMDVREADWLALSALENRDLFMKLLEFSYSDDKKMAFRASWTLTKVCDKHHELIYPYLPEIIETLPRLDNVSVIRSFARILSLSDPAVLSEKHHGLLADYCFAALSSPGTAIAVKAYTMEILYRLSLIYPQLTNELASSVRIVMEDGSAGIISKGRAILKLITGIPQGH